MVEITISGSRQFEGSEANIVQGFVIDTEGFVRVFDKLVDGESGVVRLNDGVGDLASSACDQIKRILHTPWGKG